MGISSKFKKKLFPDEKEVLFYTKNNDDNARKEKTEPSITKFKPSSFSQTEQIADKLRTYNSVFVDISELDKSNAMRMIDFLGGVMYALNGDMIKNSNKEFTFIVNKEEKVK